MNIVRCAYCDRAAPLVTGKTIYPHREDLHKLFFYQCRQCDALVGCHKSTLKPLGRLADANLRRWKQRAHQEFDPLWKIKMKRDGCSKGSARNAGYRWLAGRLGIEVEDCHIGMMDEEECKKVVDICSKYRV